MENNEIVSIFEVTEYKAGNAIREVFEEAIHGIGQDPIKYLRTKYHKLSHFVLKGFEINGEFKELYIKGF